MGLGGVMLGSSEWAGGLRDRQLSVAPEQRTAVDPEIQATLRNVRQHVFPYHGLAVAPPASCGAAAGG
jgi:hypothetical protein